MLLVVKRKLTSAFDEQPQKRARTTLQHQPRTQYIIPETNPLVHSKYWKDAESRRTTPYGAPSAVQNYQDVEMATKLN
jgi:hypothetical protein